MGAVGNPNEALSEVGAAILATPSAGSTNRSTAFPCPAGIVNTPGAAATSGTAKGADDTPVMVTTTFATPEVWPSGSASKGAWALITGNAPSGMTAFSGAEIPLNVTLTPPREKGSGEPPALARLAP